MRKILALSACLMLSGCLGGGNGTLPDTFTLSQDSNQGQSRAPSSRQILISEPAALKTLDSEQIVVRTSQSAIQFLSDAQWNDRLPKIVQTKLAAAFENTQRLGGVGLPGEGLAIDYQIITSIRAFEVIAQSPRTALVEISVKILNDRNGSVRGTKVFRATANVNGSRNEDYVYALDRAATMVIDELVAWSLRYIR